MCVYVLREYKCFKSVQKNVENIVSNFPFEHLALLFCISRKTFLAEPEKGHTPNEWSLLWDECLDCVVVSGLCAPVVNNPGRKGIY
jgi:hypothetical protein